MNLITLKKWGRKIKMQNHAYFNEVLKLLIKNYLGQYQKNYNHIEKVTRTYLDWLHELPWEKDSFSLKLGYTENTLDELWILF